MAVSSFQKLEKIGEGTYGVVYKAREKRTGKLVALKRIRPENENEGIPATTIREILLLRHLQHSTIIKLEEVIHNDGSMFLVFEYIETDLKRLMEDFTRRNTKFDEFVQKKMSFQLCTAVAFCHSRGIFHRDLKPQNILVDCEFNIKLADFGLGRATSIPLRSYTSQIITLWYRPPELLLGDHNYDASVDIWSLGCIMTEIHTLYPLFMGDSEVDQLHKIFSVLGTPTNKDNPGIESLPNYLVAPKGVIGNGFPRIFDDIVLKSLVERMVRTNPLKRITAEEALEDEYFSLLDPIIE